MRVYRPRGWRSLIQRSFGVQILDQGSRIVRKTRSAPVLNYYRFTRALITSGIVNLRSAWILHHGSHFDVTWGQVLGILVNLGVGAVLVLRYARSARQEQRLRTEMESARRV